MPRKQVTITRTFQVHDVYEYDEAELAEQHRLKIGKEFYPTEWMENQTYLGFWIGESDGGIEDVREDEGPEEADVYGAMFFWHQANMCLKSKRTQLEQVCEAVLIMGENQDGAGI